MHIDTGLPGRTRTDGIFILRIHDILSDGTPRVCLQDGPCAARVMGIVPARLQQGTQVAVMFAAADPTAPVILGPVNSDLVQIADPESSGSEEAVEIEQRDGELILHHPRRITLKCGKAEFSLRADGRVTLDGETITSVATSVHRIAGGSLKLN